MTSREADTKSARKWTAFVTLLSLSAKIPTIPWKPSGRKNCLVTIKCFVSTSLQLQCSLLFSIVSRLTCNNTQSMIGDSIFAWRGCVWWWMIDQSIKVHFPGPDQGELEGGRKNYSFIFMLTADKEVMYQIHWCCCVIFLFSQCT